MEDINIGGRQVTSVGGVMQASAEKPRPVFTFTIPAALAKECGVTSVGMRMLTTEDELAAGARARLRGDTNGYLSTESLKGALCRMNGKAISLADGSADRMLDDMHAKLRVLVIAAYNKIHQPSEDDGRDFLSSMTITVA